MNHTIEPAVHDHPAVSDKVALASLWGNVRIVVVDVETTQSPGGAPLRAVSIAAVTCRAATVRGKWQTLVNPGVPIDRDSCRIHGITDEHVDGEPTFADILGLLLPLLTREDGETLVLAGHNIGFDVAVLRTELQLVGRDIPELPIIDTMGKLAHTVGIQPESGSLANLLAALGIVNNRPHDALADAAACADALVTLINRAATQGHTNFADLLDTISGPATTHTIRANARAIAPARNAPTLPASHMDGHATVLSRRAGNKMLAAWRTQVTECATLRCSHLTARVAEAGPAPAVLLPELELVIADFADHADVAGTATVLAATLPLLEHMPPRAGRLGFRNAALAWSKRWAPALTPLGRCEPDDQCPNCRDHEPCALDEWPATIARIALGDPGQYARGYIEMTGKDAGTGAYTTWRADGIDPRIADAAVAICVEHWRAIDQDTRASQVVDLAWHAGCRHPDIVDSYAGQLAAPGRKADLDAATSACDTVLATRNGSTSEAWTRLESRRNQLAGRAQRLAFRHSGQYDEDGNPIPARPHHPAQPRRVRPGRFIA